MNNEQERPLAQFNYSTPESNAEFFLNSVRLLSNPQNDFKQRFTKLKDKSIEVRLESISKELKRLDKDLETAGYAVGMFYHHQKKQLTGKPRELVSKAKEIYYEYICTKYQGLNENRNDPVQRELFKHKFAELAPEAFYEHHLESYKETCKLQKQEITLFSLDEASEELKKQEQDKKDLTLRKLVVTNPHLLVLNQLLEAGADPLAKGAQSGLNAIDRAQQEKLDDIANILEKHVKEKGLTDVAPSLPSNNLHQAIEQLGLKK